MKETMKKMTNELRKLIKQEIDKCTGWTTYYQLADDKAMYPHITFTLDSISALDSDIHRFDYELVIDLWNKNDVVTIEEATDKIINLFNCNNLPQDSILPTFQFESRRSVIDEDKQINHRQLVFVVQTYERN